MFLFILIELLAYIKYTLYHNNLKDFLNYVMSVFICSSK